SGDEPEISVGRCLAALLTNRIDELSEQEQRAMLGATDSGGGYLLSPTLGTQIIDLARSASVVLRAGARTIPMNTPELHLARITTDPTAPWRPEHSEVTASSLTFDRITMRAKTLAAIVPVLIELIEDAPNIGSIIEMALQQALGLKLDQAALLGKGAETEPLGIVNTGSVNAITGVGLPTDYTEITQAVGDIVGADYPGDVSALSWIMHPRDAETYDGLKDTTNQPMQPTPWAAALKRLHTTSLPSTDGGGDESTAIVGNFPQVLIGIRKSVTIRVLNSGQVTDENSETFNAASQLSVFIVASLRADVAVLRPTWFTKLTGITP
ncbi:MAG: phage major capsid protein, partial [Planctomycetes bacterium]|nr:phage major capsid protein [Planctomycetota bacterium]